MDLIHQILQDYSWGPFEEGSSQQDRSAKTYTTAPSMINHVAHATLELPLDNQTSATNAYSKYASLDDLISDMAPAPIQSAPSVAQYQEPSTWDPLGMFLLQDKKHEPMTYPHRIPTDVYNFPTYPSHPMQPIPSSHPDLPSQLIIPAVNTHTPEYSVGYTNTVSPPLHVAREQITAHTHSILPNASATAYSVQSTSSLSSESPLPAHNTDRTQSHTIRLSANPASAAALTPSDQPLPPTTRKRKLKDTLIPDSQKPPPKCKKKIKAAKDESTPKPKRTGGLNQPLYLSTALADITGVTELSRPEVVKKLWQYIKDHGLQDPADRRFILCDDKLRALFQTDRVNGFGMNKDLSAHVFKEPPVATASPTQTPMNLKHDCNLDMPEISSSPSVQAYYTTSPAVTAETPGVATPSETESWLVKHPSF